MALPQYLGLPGIRNAYGSITEPQMLDQDSLADVDLWKYNLDPMLQHNTMGLLLECRDQPTQRWVDESEKALFAAPSLQPLYSRNFLVEPLGISGAQGPIPYPYELPRYSPSLSQERLSTCSGSSASHTDDEWCSENNDHYTYDGSMLTQQTLHYIQGSPQPFAEQRLTSPSIQTLGHINLRELQRVQDLQDITYQQDEGYVVSEGNGKTANEVNLQTYLPQHLKSVYKQYDETLGQSIEANDIADSDNIGEDDINADAINNEEEDDDAEAEAKHEIPTIEVDEDDDYNPQSTRAKRRRSSRVSSSSPIAKRTRITKSVVRPKSSFRCKVQSCTHTAKDSQALVRHVSTAHTRPFVCAFGFAGCRGTFGSKNEWKRHVSSQHLALHYWRCEIGQCGRRKADASKTGSASPRGSEFNRKDLFTQHLRRMHAPLAVKRQNKKSHEWDAQVKRLQTECLRIRRYPPTRTICPVESCQQMFEGQNCWDARMEHVGKHLDRAGAKRGDEGVIEQQRDHLLIEYALREKIIECGEDGGYQLCRDSASGADEDAESFVFAATAPTTSRRASSERSAKTLNGAFRLGKDGILRSLAADGEVVDAVALRPALIKALLDRMPYDAQNEIDSRGVDGTKVQRGQ
ncbi:MAG: hypothetical protein M1818_002671 [Claussenomyces sp. TS43310]|nr:MAG: hypothetical protein M1818_002671 [Claussenomyces sp. TS43310]